MWGLFCWLPCRLLPNFICWTNRWGCSASRRLWLVRAVLHLCGQRVWISYEACIQEHTDVYHAYATRPDSACSLHPESSELSTTMRREKERKQCFAIWIWATKIILISNCVFMFSKPTQWSHRCLWSNPKMHQMPYFWLNLVQQYIHSHVLQRDLSHSLSSDGPLCFSRTDLLWRLWGSLICYSGDVWSLENGIISKFTSSESLMCQASCGCQYNNQGSHFGSDVTFPNVFSDRVCELEPLHLFKCFIQFGQFSSEEKIKTAKIPS